VARRPLESTEAGWHYLAALLDGALTSPDVTRTIDSAIAGRDLLPQKTLGVSA